MSIENLSTSRVLVIDDVPEEAVPIMTALGEIGVGSIYVKGDKVEELPENPVRGIRLVFIDLRLDEGGDSKSVLSKTVNVLKRCVAEETMPLVVVCWTKHKEDIEPFKKMVINEIPGLKPGFIIGMPKPATGNPSSWKGILKRIRKELRPYDAIGIVWQWENVLHGAATETSQRLADVSADLPKEKNSSAGDWQEGMLRLCRELVKAEVGKTGHKGIATSALFRVMNQLAMDRIQYSVLKSPARCADKLVPKVESALGLRPTSILNQMILVEPVGGSDKSIKPGNIYQPAPRRCLFVKLDVNKDEVWKTIANKEGNNGAPPVLIEISPGCDYVQDKRPVCTFIAGYVLPADKSWEKRKAEHIYALGPLVLPGQTDPKKIVISKRHLYAKALLERNISNNPICRLRSNVLVDLQVKLAAYKSRPGIISLEYRK